MKNARRKEHRNVAEIGNVNFLLVAREDAWNDRAISQSASKSSWIAVAVFSVSDRRVMADVAVTGLGGVGRAAAWHVAHRGASVVGFERTKWWRWEDSNFRHAAYETAALTPELHRPIKRAPASSA